MMDVQLVMYRPNGEHRPFPLSKQTTVIGRREDCDLRIAVRDVSRKHCRIIVDLDDEVVRVEDLGSSNGTFVNGERVQSQALHAGDTVQVGPVAFVLMIDGAPAVDEIAPRMKESSEAVSGSSGEDLDAETAEPAAVRSRPAAGRQNVGLGDANSGSIDELAILNDSGDGSIDLDSADK